MRNILLTIIFIFSSLTVYGSEAADSNLNHSAPAIPVTGAYIVGSGIAVVTIGKVAQWYYVDGGDKEVSAFVDKVNDSISSKVTNVASIASIVSLIANDSLSTLIEDIETSIPSFPNNKDNLNITPPPYVDTSSETEREDSILPGADIATPRKPLPESVPIVKPEENGHIIHHANDKEIVSDFIQGLEKGDKKRWAEQYIKKGGFAKALEEFYNLPLTNVFTAPNGTIVGTLPDGMKVNVRDHSSGDNSDPTIEFKISDKKQTKIRYQKD